MPNFRYPAHPSKGTKVTGALIRVRVLLTGVLKKLKLSLKKTQGRCGNE